MPLDGSVPMTGDITIKNADPSITLDGTAGHKDSIFGQKGDKNRWELVLGDATLESGSNAGSNFDLIAYADDGTTVTGTALFGTRSTALLTVKGDPTAALGVATKQYADATAVNAASSKLPIAGGTITGNLQVNGELIAVQNYIRFGNSGGPGYLIWNGGGNYALGGGGTIWHSGNLTPSAVTSDARLQFAGDYNLPADNQVYEPYAGAVATGFSKNFAGGYVYSARFRYLQLLRGGTWFTVGYT
jgi:hypothetical protein